MPFRKFEIDSLLLVEDSEDDVIITQRKLFKTNMQIKEFVVAKTLTQALEVVEKKSIEIVLLDLNLPESSGLDTLDKLRSAYNGIIIVVTSLDDESLGLTAIQRGADEYLVKNDLSETTIARTILHCKERAKLYHHVQAVKQKLDQLSKLGG
jgi:DNA-binding response OmpR family regulator